MVISQSSEGHTQELPHPQRQVLWHKAHLAVCCTPQCSHNSLPGGPCWGGAVSVTLTRTCSAELLFMVCPGAWGCTSPGTGPCTALGLTSGSSVNPFLQLVEVLVGAESLSGISAAPPPVGNSAKLLRVPWALLFRPLSRRKWTGPSTGAWATLLMISLYLSFILPINTLYLKITINS